MLKAEKLANFAFDQSNQLALLQFFTFICDSGHCKQDAHESDQPGQDIELVFNTNWHSTGHSCFFFFFLPPLEKPPVGWLTR